MDQPRLLVERLLAASGPGAFPPRVLWPLHRAIRDLIDDAGRQGIRRLLPGPLNSRPSPEGGIEIVGVGRAMRDLLADGVLEKVGSGRRMQLALNPDAVPGLRRALMLEPPELVACYRIAGANWAALSAIASKNVSMAVASSGS